MTTLEPSRRELIRSATHSYADYAFSGLFYLIAATTVDGQMESVVSSNMKYRPPWGLGLAAAHFALSTECDGVLSPGQTTEITEQVDNTQLGKRARFHPDAYTAHGYLLRQSGRVAGAIGLVLAGDWGYFSDEAERLMPDLTSAHGYDKPATNLPGFPESPELLSAVIGITSQEIDRIRRRLV